MPHAFPVGVVDAEPQLGPGPGACHQQHGAAAAQAAGQAPVGALGDRAHRAEQDQRDAVRERGDRLRPALTRSVHPQAALQVESGAACREGPEVGHADRCPGSVVGPGGGAEREQERQVARDADGAAAVEHPVGQQRAERARHRDTGSLSVAPALSWVDRGRLHDMSFERACESGNPDGTRALERHPAPGADRPQLALPISRSPEPGREM